LVCLPLCFVCIGVPLLIAVELGGLVLCIIDIINASGGQCKPLPVIGKFADKWFGKIQKVLARTLPRYYPAEESIDSFRRVFALTVQQIRSKRPHRQPAPRNPFASLPDLRYCSGLA